MVSLRFCRTLCIEVTQTPAPILGTYQQDLSRFTVPVVAVPEDFVPSVSNPTAAEFWKVFMLLCSMWSCHYRRPGIIDFAVVPQVATWTST
jgi:hypothetical protein